MQLFSDLPCCSFEQFFNDRVQVHRDNIKLGFSYLKSGRLEKVAIAVIVACARRIADIKRELGA